MVSPAAMLDRIRPHIPAVLGISAIGAGAWAFKRLVDSVDSYNDTEVRCLKDSAILATLGALIGLGGLLLRRRSTSPQTPEQQS